MKRVMLYISLMMITTLVGMSEARAKEEGKRMEQQERLIFDFTNMDEIEMWRIVNDGVMGGLSRGEIVVGSSNTLIFKGIVSLENNGGFASIRTMPRSYELGGYDGILLRVRGDGKEYQFRLRTDDRFDGISYRYKFETELDTWMTVRVPFHDCMAVFRGRVLDSAEPLDPGKIQQIGFLISNKRAEQFQLEIDWMRAYKK